VATKAKPVPGDVAQPSCIPVRIERINHAFMRALQYWILVFGSSFVSILLIREVFLSRDLTQAQSRLTESQEVVSQGTAFENAWKQLAVRIYEIGNHDPALMELLKKENVGIHTESSPNGGSAPASTSFAPSASSQTPGALVPPTTP